MKYKSQYIFIMKSLINFDKETKQEIHMELSKKSAFEIKPYTLHKAKRLYLQIKRSLFWSLQY